MRGSYRLYTMQQLGSLAAQCASESTLLWREQRGLSSSFVVHAAIWTTQACRERGCRGPLHPQIMTSQLTRRSRLCPPHYNWRPRILRSSYGPTNDYSDDDDDRSQLNERRWSLGFKPFGNTAAVVHCRRGCKHDRVTCLGGPGVRGQRPRQL